MIRALALLLALLMAGQAAAQINTACPAQTVTEVADYAATFHPTGLIVVRNGVTIACAGDIRAKVNTRSVRKSLISLLYGLAVAEGRIRLDDRLDTLGIDDTPPALTVQEKQATVRDLLMARSGVYHKAAYETAEMGRRRPARGSHPPGTFWYYNNWDFNALGTIYRQCAGDIFDSFSSRIAQPLGLEDFSARDGETVTETVSRHAAYPFRLTARDMARIGQMVLQQGQWNGRQVVPADWIKVSTSPLSATDRGERGYGYLWWTLPEKDWGRGATFAAGYGGQVILVLPAHRLVIAQTASGKPLHTQDLLRLARLMLVGAH